jgi:hypothetical protein
MVTAGVRSTGLLALTAASGEIHNAWATFGRVTGAKEAEPNFRMTDNLPLAYLRSTLRRQGRSIPLCSANVSSGRFRQFGGIFTSPLGSAT